MNVYLRSIERERHRMRMTRRELVALLRTAADLFEIEGAGVYPIELPLGSLIWRLRTFVARHKASRKESS